MKFLIYNVLIGNQIVVQSPQSESQLGISLLEQLKVREREGEKKERECVCVWRNMMFLIENELIYFCFLVLDFAPKGTGFNDSFFNQI